jgi:hypothetical protein
VQSTDLRQSQLGVKHQIRHQGSMIQELPHVVTQILPSMLHTHLGVVPQHSEALAIREGDAG